MYCYIHSINVIAFISYDLNFLIWLYGHVNRWQEMGFQMTDFFVFFVHQHTRRAISDQPSACTHSRHRTAMATVVTVSRHRRYRRPPRISSSPAFRCARTAPVARDPRYQADVRAWSDRRRLPRRQRRTNHRAAADGGSQSYPFQPI